MREVSVPDAPRSASHGGTGIEKGAMFGGGADFPLRRWIGGRLEVRDLYTGNPSVNIPLRGSGQHNLIIGGAFALTIGGGE